MNNPIQAVFTGDKLIQGRKVRQLIFEVPVEKGREALNYLGDPMPDQSIWCVIAKLDITKSEKPKRRFDELPLSQQAALLCQKPEFWAFLNEKIALHTIDTEENAATLIYDRCQIASRAELDVSKSAIAVFKSIRDDFYTWKAVERVT